MIDRWPNNKSPEPKLVGAGCFVPRFTSRAGGGSALFAKPSMRHTVYWSRLYLFPQFLAVVGLGAALFTYRTEMSAIIVVVAELMLAFVAAAYLRWLIVRKPVLTIDETGFTYHHARIPVIHWDDVVSAERRPRVERYAGGASSTCVREAWRIIRIRVRGKQDNVEWNISPMGLDTDSAKIYECIYSQMQQNHGRQ